MEKSNITILKCNVTQKRITAGSPKPETATQVII